MQVFKFLGWRNARTPQSEPIPGSAQVPNSAGGYAWAVDDWARLERFLILGSEGGSYYATERALTRENAHAVEHCIRTDGARTVSAIVDISVAGRAPRNDPALFALAMCASLGDDSTRALALEALPRVARIGTHLLHFISFAEQFRGWGRGLRKAVGAWFNDMDPRDLAYQVTKYPQRDQWALRDALRLAHPIPRTPQHGELLKWVVGKGAEADGSSWDEEVGGYMAGVQLLAHTKEPRMAAQLIRELRLPREVVPTELLTSAAVWDALLDDMPMTAMIRNLATMTRVGLVAPLSDGTRRVLDEIGKVERIRRARVHPIAVLGALMTYKSGRGIRGRNTWTPVTQVVDALDAAFYTAFDNVTPSGARTLLALDASASMEGGMISGIPGLTPRVGSAAMALLTARTEPRHSFVAFTSGDRPSSIPGYGSGITTLDISASMRLDGVVDHVRHVPFGGTDCALPMIWAREQKVPVDTFAVYTDSETWAGDIHPSQALRDYRQAMGIPAKLVVVGMVSNGFTIADPDDAGMLDVVGFDTAAPQVISDFSKPVG
jgi:60 kDa SS-A/Ro ribonucleoprotein